MTTFQEMPNAISGNFRIAGPSMQEVLLLLEEWCSAEDGHRFHYLAARLITPPGESREECVVGIDFLYALPGEKSYELEHKDFFHKRSDQLRRRYGNGLTRWDISSPVTVVRFKTN